MLRWVYALVAYSDRYCLYFEYLLKFKNEYNNPYVLHKMNSVVCYCLLEYGLLG